MRISNDEEQLLRQIALPAVFFREYLATLDLATLRTYLGLVFLAALDGEFRPEDLARFLALESRELSRALSLLAQRGLIELNDNGARLVDLRAAALGAQLRCPAGKEKAAGKAPSEREAVIRQINDAFFQGMMPTHFYRHIDQWFENYGFKPAVVYTLFTEAVKYGKESNPGYLSAIAANWASQGIRDFSQLNCYFERRGRIRELAEKVRVRLRLRSELNGYQLERLEVWALDWGFDFPVIDEALRRSSRSGPANFDYAESMLREWQQAGLRTLEQIQGYEAMRGSRRRGSHRENGRQRGPIGNFEQRSYSDAEMEALYTVVNETPLPEMNGLAAYEGEKREGASEGEDDHV